MSVYAFGPFILEAAERRLTRNGRRLAVPGKAWQILQLLAEAGGRLVSHEMLRAKLWPDVVVEDRTLTVHVSTLRKALGDGLPSDFIETVTKAGYRLTAPVRVLPGAGPPSQAAAASPRQVSGMRRQARPYSRITQSPRNAASSSCWARASS